MLTGPGVSRTLLAVAASAAFCGAAAAQRDVTYGGDARAFAMGGAGIALLRNQGTGGSRANPASLAFEKQPLSVNFPSVAIRANGPISIGSAYDYLSSGQSLDDAADLTRSLADRDSEFGINANTSIRFGKIEVGAMAVARGRLQPNESLRNWVAAGRPSTAIPTDVRSDLFAAGYYTLPTIAGASTLPVPPSRPFNVAIGGRLKYMTGIYTHYVADFNTISRGSEPPLAPEMNGKESLTKKGVGVDLGVLLKQRGDDGYSAAFVVANALKPNLKFTGTDRNGLRRDYDLAVTTASLGAGYEKKGSAFAADLVDITQGAGDRQLRVGAEQRFGGNLAVRGGYSTATGFTYGVGFFGFDVAFGRRQPLEVVRTLNF